MKLSVYQAFSVLLVASLQIRVSAQTSTSKWLQDTRRPVAKEAKSQCDCKCGETNPGSKIYGGEPTGVNQYPWMARLSSLGDLIDSFCGGSLINDRYVLTAAHCIVKRDVSQIRVTFGEWDRCNTSAKPMTRFVSRAIVGNFSYNNTNFMDHDIALLRLNDRVPIVNITKPVCLPTAVLHNNYAGKTGVVMGWGDRRHYRLACKIRHTKIPILSNDFCKTSTKYTPENITDNMMCAGYMDGSKDSCQGDSGGPIVVEREHERYEIAGIVSWGRKCGLAGYPGVYTRVTRYVKWIRENAKDGCFCKN